MSRFMLIAELNNGRSCIVYTICFSLDLEIIEIWIVCVPIYSGKLVEYMFRFMFVFHFCKVTSKFSCKQLS